MCWECLAVCFSIGPPEMRVKCVYQHCFSISSLSARGARITLHGVESAAWNVHFHRVDPFYRFHHVNGTLLPLHRKLFRSNKSINEMLNASSIDQARIPFRRSSRSARTGIEYIGFNRVGP